MVAPDSLASVPGVGIDGAGPSRYGEIFDRGYRHYDGPRLGRRHAIWALILYSVKRAMGIKKSWTAKVIPFLLYIAISIPVFVGIGIRAFTDEDVLPYADFFGIVYLIEGIFVATIAPEMVCGDRREHVLQLYFSRAITRADYVLAKLGATALLTLSISLLPILIYWLGVQLIDDSPVSAIVDSRDDLAGVLITGTLIALYLGSVGLVISTFTGRKSIAVAIIIIGFLISTAVGAALFEALEGEIRRYTIFLSPTHVISGLAYDLFDTTPNEEWVAVANFSAGIYAVYMLGVAAVATAIMYLRYRPNE